MDKNQLAVSLFDRYALRYQEKYMDQQQYRQSFDTFCQLLPEQAALLELGCGPGNLTHYLLQLRPDLQILATDLAPQMLALAQTNNPAIQTQLLDCRDILTLQRRFTAVVAGFVTPYLNPAEVQQLLRDIRKSLEPEGLLLLSTMAGAPSLSGWQGPSDGGPDRLYMYYHAEEWLRNALVTEHFEIVQRQQVAISPDAEEPYDLLLLARYQPKIA